MSGAEFWARRYPMICQALVRAMGPEGLKNLHERLWEEPQGQRTRGAVRRPTAWRAKGQLDPEEWDAVRHVIGEADLVCVMGHHAFGFKLAMHVWKAPQFPGTDPEHLVTVADMHLPFYPYGGYVPWDFAWDVFATFTHTDRNREKAQFSGLPLPQEKTRYAY